MPIDGTHVGMDDRDCRGEGRELPAQRAKAGCFYEAEPEQVLKHVQDEAYPEFVRVSGDCICTQCSRDYYSHPLAPEWTDWDSEPYLNRLCDGRLVKL